MLHQKNHLEIPINGRRGVVTLYVYPQSSNAKLFEDDAPYSDKVKYHLMEGCIYTYEFVCADEQFTNSVNRTKSSNFTVQIAILAKEQSLQVSM